MTNSTNTYLQPKKLISYAWLMWLCAATYYFYQYVLRASPSIMSHHLMKDFAVSGCSLGVLSAFYYNAYATMQIPLGMMMDRFGPRRIISISCAIAATGTFVFSTAESLNVASFGRMLVGAGAACGFIGTLKIGTIWFPIHRLGRVIGLTMLLGTLGGIFGGAPLGFMIDNMGWRYTLFVLALMGFSLALTIYLVVRDSPAKQHVTPIVKPEPSAGFFDGLYQVITTKQIWLLAVFGCFMYVPLAAFADLWGTPYITELYKINNKLAASLISSIWTGVAVGSPITVLISDYMKNRRIPMFLAALGSLLVYGIIIYIQDIPLELMYVLMFAAGFVFTGQNLVFAAVAEITPLSASGVAVGFLNMMVMLSGVIFQPLVGWLLDFHWNGVMAAGVPAFTTADFQFALLPIPLVLFFAICLLWFIKESYR